MPIRSILVPLVPDLAATPQLEAALRVAGAVGGHIRVLHVRPDPETLFATMPEAFLTSIPERDRYNAEALAERTRARAAFDAWRERHDLAAGPFDPAAGRVHAAWSSRVGPIEVATVEAGRLADLIVLRLPGMPHIATGQAFDAAVFESGRPVLLTPEAVPEVPLHHIMIAWNGSREATRALAGASPLLHAAGRVSVFVAAPTEAERARVKEVGAYLSWHGIMPTEIVARVADAAAGAALLAAAAEQGATMLVMGAFTRGRLRQLLLGGATSHVLKHTRLPVLMAH
jgi:nucleotide-binding universal stress UspA family protein